MYGNKAFLRAEQRASRLRGKHACRGPPAKQAACALQRCTCQWSMGLRPIGAPLPHPGSRETATPNRKECPLKAMPFHPYRTRPTTVLETGKMSKMSDSACKQAGPLCVNLCKVVKGPHPDIWHRLTIEDDERARGGRLKFEPSAGAEQGDTTTEPAHQRELIPKTKNQRNTIQ